MEIRQVDYRDPKQAEALVYLLNAYASEPFGGGAPLASEVQETLCDRLSEVSSARSFVAWVDGAPVGLINTFEGFSTFSARPLINIHDVYVHPSARGTGVLEQLFNAVETEAKARNCCKITLEVMASNERAKRGYSRLGYGGYELGDLESDTLFWQKKLD